MKTRPGEPHSLSGRIRRVQMGPGKRDLPLRLADLQVDRSELAQLHRTSRWTTFRGENRGGLIVRAHDNQPGLGFWARLKKIYDI